MTTARSFPVQHRWHPGCSPSHGIRSIPWEIAEEAYAAYAREYPGSARLQSLSRMAERGGFSDGELDTFVPGWRNRDA